MSKASASSENMKTPLMVKINLHTVLYLLGRYDSFKHAMMKSKINVSISDYFFKRAMTGSLNNLWFSMKNGCIMPVFI